mmetsp:Transcript_81323/g.159663  ORF Transcript_81323/g.159663 Transcript_81323/m.159663 type:complete len:560 (+) Transcript_81323:44-1723(+)
MHSHTRDRFSDKGFDHFFYGEIRDSAKNAMTSQVEEKFQKMRESLNWTNNSKVTTLEPTSTPPLKKQGLNVTPAPAIPSKSPAPAVPAVVAEPRNWQQWSPVPSHIVPKREKYCGKSLESFTPSKQGHSPNRSFKEETSTPKAEHARSKTPNNQRTPIPNPNVSFPERHDLVRTLGSSHSLLDGADGADGAEQGKLTTQLTPSSTPIHTFHGVRAVSADKLKRELHLHHDIFLRSHDDAVVDAVSLITKSRNTVTSRYPHISDELLDYSLKPDVLGARHVIPSHVVPPRPRSTTSSQLRLRRGSDVAALQNCSSSRSISAGKNRAQSKHQTVTTATTAIANHNIRNKVKSVDEGETKLLKSFAQSVKSSGNGAATVTTERSVRGEFVKSVNLKSSPKPHVDVNGLRAEGSMSDLRGESPNTVTDTLSPINSVGDGSKCSTPQQRRFDFSITTTTTTNANTTTTAVSTESSAKLQKASATVPHSTAASSSPGHTDGDRLCNGAYSKRPLTAAEHAAALSLNTKLTAANLAYHRELSPPLKPQRSMSRALSQLVYNVRCEE